MVFHHIGQWVLPGAISLNDIEALAKEWADDDRYLSVHVRKTSEGRWALGVEYKNPDGFDQEAFEKYLDQTKHFFFARFGIEHVGYDLANVYHRL